jgi:hypothetical protein
VPRKAARKQAMAALSTMMGSLVLARVAGSGEFSDEILGAGREAVLGRADIAVSESREIQGQKGRPVGALRLRFLEALHSTLVVERRKRPRLRFSQIAAR